MKPDPEEIVRRILPHRRPVRESAGAFAPANIALCKYWGKRDEALKLPVTGSLSISLGDLGTRMHCRLADQDALVINGQPQPADRAAALRLFAFLNLFREPGTFFEIESVNTIPMAAGLASSASAFAAVVNTLDRLYGWELPEHHRSILARLGSGSAARSLCRGFVEWHRGEREDGMDSYAEGLGGVWPEFRVGILTLSDAEKAVGSGEGMRRTQESSLLYAAWPDQVARDLPRIRESVQRKDFRTLGQTAEQNAMAMHATMIAAWPPVLYWRPESVQMLQRVHALRGEGAELYATMDAGPNVKLLFTEESEASVQDAFPDLRVVAPFAPPS